MQVHSLKIAGSGLNCLSIILCYLHREKVKTYSLMICHNWSAFCFVVFVGMFGIMTSMRGPGSNVVNSIWQPCFEFGNIVIVQLFFFFYRLYLTRPQKGILQKQLTLKLHATWHNYNDSLSSVKNSFTAITLSVVPSLC